MLKLLVGTLGFGWMALFAFIIYGSFKSEVPEIMMGLLIPTIGVGVFIGLIVNRIFSEVIISGSGIRVKRMIGETDVPWAEIEKIKYWEEIQSSSWGAGTAREPFAEVRDINGVRRLLFKSTYDPELFTVLCADAQEHGVSVEGSPGSIESNSPQP